MSDNKVFVTGLGFKSEDREEFLEIVKRVGNVKNVDWTRDRTTGKFYGSGFVTFETSDDAKRVEEMEIFVRGRKVTFVKSLSAKDSAKVAFSHTERSTKRISVNIPETIGYHVSVSQPNKIDIDYFKISKKFVYVKLWGGKVDMKDRGRVLNLLERYFDRYGKIDEVRRMKENTHHLETFSFAFPTN